MSLCAWCYWGPRTARLSTQRQSGLSDKVKLIGNIRRQNLSEHYQLSKSGVQWFGQWMEITACLPLWEGFIEEEEFERGLRGWESAVEKGPPRRKGAGRESPVRKADVGQIHKQVLLIFHSQHQCLHLALHSSGFPQMNPVKKTGCGRAWELAETQEWCPVVKASDSLPILNSLEYLGFRGWVRGDSLLRRRKGVGEAPGSKVACCLRVHIYFLCMLLMASSQKPN